MAKKYNEVTPEILEQFKAIVPGKVYAGEEINSDYFHDEMPIYGKGAPEVVIEATTTEDIAAIVKVCYENSLPVIPRVANFSPGSGGYKRPCFCASSARSFNRTPGSTRTTKFSRS